VSARNQLMRSTFAWTALASNASFNPSIAAVPQSVVNFINVVGCWTCPSNGIRQNRRRVIESATPGTTTRIQGSAGTSGT